MTGSGSGASFNAQGGTRVENPFGPDRGSIEQAAANRDFEKNVARQNGRSY